MMFKKVVQNKERIQLEITGMTCDGCAAHMEKLTNFVKGVLRSKVSYSEGKGEFIIDSNLTSKEAIVNAINASGNYKVVEKLENCDSANTETYENKADCCTVKTTNGTSATLVKGRSNSSSKSFDFIIVGGGSAAFSAAIKANELGLNTLIVNDGLPIGGTCVNVGCVPSKYLIRAAESIHKASHSPFSGVTTQMPSVAFPKIIREKRALVEALRKKKYSNILDRLEFVQTVKGFASFKDEKTIVVNGEQEYTAIKFLVATGATTKIPPISGLNEAPFLTNRSLFEMEKLPKSLIVLGGGYIALEIAQAYHRFGSKVTLLQRSERILSKQSPDVSEEILKHLREDGLDVHTGQNFQRVAQRDGKIVVKTLHNGSPAEYSATQLVVATGITPNTSKLGFEKAGLELTRSGHIKVNGQLETNNSRIFAAGDCINTPAYVYTAAYEGNLAVENAFTSAGKSTNYDSMPWVVFTDPQVAGVGMDEREAERKGIPFEVNVFPLTEVPRSLAALDTRGFVKLIRNPETDKLLGATIVAAEGSELTMELSMAIKYGIPVKELGESFHAYLTLSEAVKLAAISFGKDVSKLSCCAS